MNAHLLAFKHSLLENGVSIETSNPPALLPSGILTLTPNPFVFHAILLQRDSWMEISPCLLWGIGLHPNHKI